MRVLAILPLLFVPMMAAAAPRPLAAFVPAEPAVVVVAVDFDATPDPERVEIAGKVKLVKRDRDGIYHIHLDKQRFQVALPSNVKLPIRRGDQVRAAMWIGNTDKRIHARVTDAAGAPLVFMNELPDDWTMTIADIAKDRPDGPPVYQHRVQLAAPAIASITFAGWLIGAIDRHRYIVYAEARVVDQAEAQRMGVTVNWDRSLFSGIVRVR